MNGRIVLGMLLTIVVVWVTGCGPEAGPLVRAPENNEPTSREHTGMFNVRDYNAKGDGVALDTAAIQATIEACAQSGGGVVHLPAGRYLSGTVFLKSNITLDLAADAILLGSGNFNDYSRNVKVLEYYPFFSQCLLYAEEANNIRLTGQGTIDGQGNLFPQGDTTYRPMLIRMIHCQNIVIDGLCFRRSGSWCTHIVECANLRVHGLRIENRSNLNNDGLDLHDCRDVTISDCHLDCEDDAIALKGSAENVAITNCLISSYCAAFRIGPESTGRFGNIVMSNCVIRDTFHNGIKIQMVEGGTVENVLFSNLVMDNVTGPISIRLGQWLGFLGAKETAEHKVDKRVEPLPVGTLRNVVISNVVARVPAMPPSLVLGDRVYPPPEGARRSCISIMGLPGHPPTDITLSNMRITFAGGGTQAEADRRDVPELADEYPEYYMFGTLPAYGLYARHARGIVLQNVCFDLDEVDARPAIITDDVEGIEFNGFRAATNGVSHLIRLIQTREAFIHGCRPLGPVATFLRMEGEQSKAIVLKANDLRQVQNKIDYDPKVKTPVEIAP